ncbi:MAG: glycine zipper 2TM domain-containing protein [Rhizorhabdus sp.]
MRTFKTAALALTIPGMLAVSVPAGAATASYPAQIASHDASAQTFEHSRDRRDRYNRYDDSRYGRRGYYEEPVYNNTRTWRGNDGRYYCKKKNGTTGLIIGGAAGALLGREIAGRGDNTLGAILGGAGGALLGREVERGGSRCR